MFDDRTIERFWARVNKRSGYIAPYMDTECWEWTGGSYRGYGRLQVNNKRWGAHRFAYTLAFGQIDDALLVCHRCDNPGCVRPDHLFAGTHSDNTRDMMEKGRGIVRATPMGFVTISPRTIAKVEQVERVAKTEMRPWQPPSRNMQRRL